MAKARRAKKSKFPKKLLLVPVALIGIGTTVATFNNNTIISKSIEAQVETQEASNFVKDIFTEENTKYLPIIYTDPYEKITRENLEEEFRKAGMPIKSFSTATIGTGTKIETENATYTVLIYGDVDGNGSINVRDIQAIVKHLLYGNGSELKGISRIAANVDNEKENVINVRDAQRIVQFLIGKKSIIDSTPTSDLVKDKEAPVITLNGEKEVKIKVFEKYEDIGATVKDNLDPNVKVEVDTSKLNTEIPGTYEVYYNATDASGNRAQTVVRKVIVEDYVDGIEISIFPKQQYVVGQVPDLSTMVAYPIYKYAGIGNEAVDVSEITVTPSVITEDMIGNSELKINYKGFEKIIPIIVTEQVPVIELNNYNGATDVKIRVNEVYNEEQNLKAYDEQDQKYYDVSISGTVDTTIPGEYIITYTSEPNSIGKVGKIERKVTVVDYIKDVKFVIDTTKFLDTKTYLDNETIDVTGITAKLVYETGKIETTDKFIYEKTAKYKQGNINQELVISYVVTDPIDPKITKTYTSTNNTYDISDTSFSNSTTIMIKVCKRFVSTSLVGTAKNVAKIYEDTLIATVKEGTDEAPISVDALDIKVTPGNVDEHGCTARAWAVPSTTTNGALDIYFVGVMNRGETNPVTSYTITLTPKSEGGVARNIAVVTEASEVVNEVKTANPKVDGKTMANETEFQVGTTLALDLDFFRNYSHNGYGHSVEINKVLRNNEVTATVNDAATNTAISGVTASIVKNSANVVTGVNITASNSAVATNSGKDIILVVDVNNGSANGVYRYTLTMKLYAKSVYTLETNNNDTITLGFREGNFDGYQIKEIDGKYYTILPIVIKDQYAPQVGNKNITSADLNNTILFDIMKKGTNNYVSANNNIEVIGLNDSYSKVNTGITNLGIAIKGNEEELEQAKSLKISFGSSATKEYNNPTNAIIIKRREVSELEDYNTWSTGEYKGADNCYEDIKAVKVTSGEKQEKLTADELENIGYIIEKEVKTNGVTTRERVLDALPSRDKFSSNLDISKVNNSITVNEKILKVGITTTVENGIATVSLWSGNAGKYFVTPYYNRSDNTASSSNGLTVTENIEVNAIKINNELQNVGTAPIGSPKIFSIEFIHEYQNAIAKTGKVEEGKIKNVNNKALSFNLREAPASIIEKIEMIADNKIISYKKDTITGDYVSDSTYDNALIDKIRISIKDGVSEGQTEKFVLKIDHNNIPGSTIKTKYTSKEFVIGAERKLEIDHLNIGWKEYGTTTIENLPICLTEAEANRVTTGEEVFFNTADNLYYTMIPVTFEANDKTPIISAELKAGLVSYSETTKDNTTGEYITLLDNSYTSGAPDFGDEARLSIKGFKKQSNGTFIEKSGDAVIDYIGIAFSPVLDGDEDLLERNAPDWFNPDDYDNKTWDEVRLKEVKVYYEGSVIKTFNITH